MKRGVLSLPFVFIMALLIIALVLVFGIRVIKDIISTADLTELTTFVNQLQSNVNTNKGFDAGSSKVISLNLPRKVKKICFVNSDKELNNFFDEDLITVIRENKKDNMYIMPLDAFPAPAPDFQIKDLIVLGDKNPLCFNTNGKLNAVIETTLYENDVYVGIKNE